MFFHHKSSPTLPLYSLEFKHYISSLHWVKTGETGDKQHEFDMPNENSMQVLHEQVKYGCIVARTGAYFGVFLGGFLNRFYLY